MKEITRLHQLQEDAQCQQELIICKGYVTLLCKRCAKLEKMCNQLFLLN